MGVFEFWGKRKIIARKTEHTAMNHRHSELKGKIIAAAEEAIEELLEWETGHPASDFGEIEQLVLKIRKQLGERITGALLEAQASQRPVPGPKCETCGHEMQYKGDKERGFGSLVGDIEMKRGYYYCGHCDRGVFPPG